jgi:hypothetical protein
MLDVRTREGRLMVGKPQENKIGARVRLVYMADDPDPIPPGTEGVIVAIDDWGTVHVDWDNGRALGLIPTDDRWKVLDAGSE